MNKSEIHTEIIAFGNHYYFEKHGAKCEPENSPKEGFEVSKKIHAGKTKFTKFEFESFLASIADEHQERSN